MDTIPHNLSHIFCCFLLKQWGYELWNRAYNTDITSVLDGVLHYMLLNVSRLS